MGALVATSRTPEQINGKVHTAKTSQGRERKKQHRSGGPYRACRSQRRSRVVSRRDIKGTRFVNDSPYGGGGRKRYGLSASGRLMGEVESRADGGRQRQLLLAGESEQLWRRKAHGGEGSKDLKKTVISGRTFV